MPMKCTLGRSPQVLRPDPQRGRTGADAGQELGKKAQFTHGMHINFVFRNSEPKLSRFVLEELGMPFKKPEENTGKSKPKA